MGWVLLSTVAMNLLKKRVCHILEDFSIFLFLWYNPTVYTHPAFLVDGKSGKNTSLMTCVICLSCASWENRSSHGLPDTHQASDPIGWRLSLQECSPSSDVHCKSQVVACSVLIMKDVDNRPEMQSEAVGEGVWRLLPSPPSHPAGTSTQSAIKAQSLAIGGFVSSPWKHYKLNLCQWQPILFPVPPCSAAPLSRSHSFPRRNLSQAQWSNQEPQSSTHELLGTHTH